MKPVGLILWGISVDRQYHWMVGQVALAMCKWLFIFPLQRYRKDGLTLLTVGAGVQMGNTVTTSYIVDCYPLQTMSIVTFYSVHLNMSAFISPFFIVPWVEKSGFTWTFAAQGIIVCCFCLPVFVLVQIFGRHFRRSSGMPSWMDPEHET